MEYLYVMDYNDCTLNCIEIDDDIERTEDFYNDENTEEILSQHGFNLDECAVMWSTTKIKQINNFQHEHISD